jgi:hypothetical protein
MLCKDFLEIRQRIRPAQFKTRVQGSFDSPAQHPFESQVFVTLISSDEENKNADL